MSDRLKNLEPFVSVIIPCYNDQDGIRATLTSLSCQNYPKEKWEIIVVDNNSTDNTVETVRQFQIYFPSLRLEREFRQSSYAARNRGIDKARGDILAFLDSDMTVGPDWILKGVTDLIMQKCDYVGCRVNIHYKNSPPTIWERYNKITGFPVEQYIEKDNFAPTCCLFIRNLLLTKTGRFNANFTSGGDREFGKRVHFSGFKMYFSKYNIAHHPARSTMRSFLQKYVRVSKGRIDLKRIHPTWFGKVTFFYFMRNCWPFQHFPRNFKRQKNTEKIKMMLIDIFVKYTMTLSEIFYYLKSS